LSGQGGNETAGQSESHAWRAVRHHDKNSYD
jgi:hypothetical protein